MKAIKVSGQGHTTLVDNLAVPTLPSQEHILVKVIAVALNPTDWKTAHMWDNDSSATVGCDYAGVVVEVGSSLKKPFRKGDRVWGFLHGCNPKQPDNAAFQEYVLAKTEFVGHIPDNVSFEEAAPAGIAVITIGQGLYQSLQLPWPDKPLEQKMPILIYGGSSAMGATGIQFAKMSGFEVLTTCSPKNFDYVKSLGADKVFDYASPTVAADIRAYTNDKLFYAWDTIGEHSAPQICADALASAAPDGQKLYYCTTIYTGPSPKFVRGDVVASATLGYTVSGESFEIAKFTVPAVPEDYEFLMKWLPVADRLFAEGRWRNHRPDVRSGIEGILQGLDDLKMGRVSAAKLVYRIGEP
ncbi:putative zinc-binding oxidoreductase ToxD [Massariosphaeria phaeospora]|uniref:Putative zinc-binding oxidoreductase ToxD n=1 Tax=Massariosphaeria phaeospora TaxID=100035 RepID=A0A7C8ME14_9PLEO|nr:putative zinc-binding oxidoreductase ToxD [Massariosphaeria phaeospora]